MQYFFREHWQERLRVGVGDVFKRSPVFEHLSIRGVRGSIFLNRLFIGFVVA